MSHITPDQSASTAFGPSRNAVFEDVAMLFFTLVAVTAAAGLYLTSEHELVEIVFTAVADAYMASARTDALAVSDDLLAMAMISAMSVADDSMATAVVYTTAVPDTCMVSAMVWAVVVADDNIAMAHGLDAGRGRRLVGRGHELGHGRGR